MTRSGSCTQSGRTVTLTNFDGHAGLTVQVPVDKETRFYILKQP